MGEEYRYKFCNCGRRCIWQFDFKSQLVRSEAKPGSLRLQRRANICHECHLGCSHTKIIYRSWSLGSRWMGTWDDLYLRRWRPIYSNMVNRWRPDFFTES